MSVMIYTLVAIFSNDKILQSIKLTFIIVLIRLRRGSKFIYKERETTCCSVSKQSDTILYNQYHFAYNVATVDMVKSEIVKSS